MEARKKIYKILLTLIIMSAFSFGTLNSKVLANDSKSYNYSYFGNTVVSPTPYEPIDIISGKTLGVDGLNEPNDIFVSSNQLIYIVDEGNNRIVIVDEQFTLVDVIETFKNGDSEDSFNGPKGVFVTDKNHIYVADTNNNRIVHLNENNEVEKIIDSPQSELLKSNFTFLPEKIVVDNAERVYAIVNGVFDGFMEFSVDGDFTSFYGANRVQVNPIEYMWKRFSTKAQRARMVQYTPTEFTNLDIDSEGFIYATNADRSDDTVKRLNAQGADILRREGYFPPNGDVKYTVQDGKSKLVDVHSWEYEIYSVLDSNKRRIFTYNGDGFLMYVFGGAGNKVGEFINPVAIERLGDYFLVLDKDLAEITVFKPTEYGTIINEAVKSYAKGEEDLAHEYFEQAIKLNANLEFAYIGIGKSLIRLGEYKEATHYFKEGKNQKGYSKAYLLYRKEVLREYFPAIMTTLAILLILIVAWKAFRKMKGGRKVGHIK